MRPMRRIQTIEIADNAARGLCLKCPVEPVRTSAPSSKAYIKEVILPPSAASNNCFNTTMVSDAMGVGALLLATAGTCLRPLTATAMSAPFRVFPAKIVERVHFWCARETPAFCDTPQT
jgi:hypothetical protein